MGIILFWIYGEDVWGDSDYIYVANFQGLTAYSFEEDELVFLGSMEGYATGVWVRENYVYVSKFIEGLGVYVFDGSEFSIVSEINDGGYARDVVSDNLYIYLANAENGVKAYSLNCGSSQPCTDTDGGINYFVKGTVTTSNGVSRTDYCTDEPWGGHMANLIEYVCENNQRMVYGYDCPNGCVNGRCVNYEDLEEDLPDQR